MKIFPPPEYLIRKPFYKTCLVKYFILLYIYRDQRNVGDYLGAFNIYIFYDKNLVDM